MATYVGADEDVTRAFALRDRHLVRVLRYDGEGFIEHSPVFLDDNTFVVDEIADGPYYLTLGAPAHDEGHVYYNLIDQRTATWDFVFGGRPDKEYPTTDTSLELQLTGLSPWQDGDSLEAGSSNLGTFSTLRGPERGALEATTTLQLNDPRVRWPLLSESSGDDLRVTQMSTRLVDDRSYLTLTRIFETNDVTSQHGAHVVIAGQMEEVPQNATLDFELPATEFGGLREAVHPAAEASGMVVRVAGLRGWAQHGFHSYGLDLLYFVALPPLETVVGSYPYGDAAPAHWDRVLEYWISFYVEYLAAGASTGTRIPAGAGAGVLLEHSTGEMRPMMTPVQDVRINGMSAQVAPLGGLHAPIEVSWLPPVSATADEYRISLYSIFPDGAVTRDRHVATFSTADEHLYVPSELLRQDREYVLVIQALATDPAGTRVAWASALTSKFSL